LASGNHPGETSCLATARRACARIAFPFLLWLFGTFYFMGDLGKRLDDYQYVVLDPATGETRLWVTASTGLRFPTRLRDGCAALHGLSPAL
jgi:hypothetical protein